MDAGEIGPLELFTKHVRWLGLTIKKVEETVQVCRNGKPIQFKIQAGSVELSFGIHHGEHAELVSEGFAKLAEHLKKDLTKLEVEHSDL